MTTRTRKAPKKSETPTPSPSPDEVLDITPEAAPADVEADNPPEPAADAADSPVKEADVESDGESVTLRYEGLADTIRHGPFRFRPGQQVTVPSDVAEELLTWPHERFVKVVSQE